MKKREVNRILEALAMVGQISITMITSIAISLFIGYIIGKFTGAIWVTILFFFIGCASGFLGVYRLIKKYLK